MRIITTVSVVFLSFVLNASVGLAKPSTLIGSWSGGGKIKPHSGREERTRCRATVRKAPSRGAYRATYSCSSSVGLATQSVRVRKVGANSYRGTFYNSQYKVRGTITIRLSGNRQSVTMHSRKGRGTISMRRR